LEPRYIDNIDSVFCLHPLSLSLSLSLFPLHVQSSKGIFGASSLID